MSISFRDGQFRVRFSGVTDIGRVRDHNEDNFLVPEDMPLAVVSDGMGGHASGEVASQIAVQTAYPTITPIAVRILVTLSWSFRCSRPRRRAASSWSGSASESAGSSA